MLCAYTPAGGPYSGDGSMLCALLRVASPKSRGQVSHINDIENVYPVLAPFTTSCSRSLRFRRLFLPGPAGAALRVLFFGEIDVLIALTPPLRGFSSLRSFATRRFPSGRDETCSSAAPLPCGCLP